MVQSVIAVLPTLATSASASSSESALIRETLDRDGVEVRIVGSPEGALDALAAERSPVILYDADTGQPWRDALPRFFAARPGVRIVLLTEFANHKTWLDLFDNGGFDLLLRPLRPADLRAVVRCALDPPKFFHAAA